MIARAEVPPEPGHAALRSGILRFDAANLRYMVLQDMSPTDRDTMTGAVEYLHRVSRLPAATAYEMTLTESNRSLMRTALSIVAKHDCANAAPFLSKLVAKALTINWPPPQFWMLGVLSSVVSYYALSLYRKRLRQRFLCNLPYQITQPYEGKGDILDIARAGAKLTRPAEANIGDRIGIKMGSVETVGQIVWGNSHFCGVQFQRSLSGRALQHIMAQSAIGPTRIQRRKTLPKAPKKETAPKMDAVPENSSSS